MSSWKTFLAATVALALVLLAGVVSTHPVPVVSIRSLPASARNELPCVQECGWPSSLDTHSASELLDRARIQVGAQHVQWLDVTFWQELNAGAFRYQIEGRCRTGPGDRAHLRLQIQAGLVRGCLRIVSDGTHLVETLEVPGQLGQHKKVELPKLARPGEPEPTLTRLQVMHQKFIPGLPHLLALLKHDLQEPQCRAVLWGNRDCIEIRGGWSSAAGRANQKTGAFLPFDASRCCVYLDAATLWPHRVEWWGPARPGESPALLLQTEYRDPIVNQALTPEQAEREFALPPSNEPRL